MDCSGDWELVGWPHSGLRWSSETKGCPPGSILGLVLFNVSINDTDSGIAGTLSMLAYDPELSSVGDTPGRQDAIQEGLEEVGPWEPQEDQGRQIQGPQHGLWQLQYESRSELVPLLSFFYPKFCYQALHSQPGLRLGVFPTHMQDFMRFPQTQFSSLARSSRMAPSFGCILWVLLSFLSPASRLRVCSNSLCP